MHSLTLDETKVRIKDMDAIQLEISQTKPGKRYHLQFPPKYINVIITPKSYIEWPQNMTLVEDQIVVPIGLKDQDKQHISITLENGHPISFDVQAQPHRIDLAFVITFWKIQGRTIPKIILALNKRPFKPHITYTMLLVALSRVSKGDDIRILPLQEENGLDYLMKLKYDEDLEIWMEGFDPNTRRWDSKRSIEFLQAKSIQIQKRKQDARMKMQSNIPGVAKQGRFERQQFARSLSDTKQSSKIAKKDYQGNKKKTKLNPN